MQTEVDYFSQILLPKRYGGALDVPIFISRTGQRGFGFGSLIAGIAKNVLFPTIKRLGKTLGKRALTTAAEAATDIILKKENPKDVIKKRGKAFLKSSASTILKEATQKGKGRKRTRNYVTKTRFKKPRLDSIFEDEF